MSRAPGLLIATLLSLAPEAALAQEAVPSLDTPMDSSHEVQILGWSKDERRYALRVYDLLDLAGEEEEPPSCKGYVDHEGKKFRGGLSFALYEGERRIGAWRIQEAGTCTPPETARERLAQAKAALTEQGIDLAAPGATLRGKAGQRPSSRQKGRKEISQLTTTLLLPHGPWASRKLEVDCRVETQELLEDGEDYGMRRSSATFALRIRAGKSPTPLSEFRLSPAHWSLNMAGHWSPAFDSLFVSPSGRVLVALARVRHGNMRGSSSPRLLFAHVDLAERLGASPQVTAPAR
jgi:hypothetical protein